MGIPFVIDNQTVRLGNVLNELLAQTVGKPFDVATAYFALSGYRLVKDTLHQVGGFRLLLGSEPQSGADIGLRPQVDILKARLTGDLEAEPFTEETLKLLPRGPDRLSPAPRKCKSASTTRLSCTPKHTCSTRTRSAPPMRRIVSALCSHRRFEQFHRARPGQQPGAEPSPPGYSARRRPS